MNEPLVTIIIATFNSSSTLKIAISSIIYQDFNNFEVLIIGDCCTDDSEEVVISFSDKRLKWSNLAINSGSQSVPNSIGMQLSKGKYIAFLGHDDIWFPNHLSTMIASIEKSYSDFVYSSTVLMHPQLNHTIIGQKNDFSELSFLNTNAHIPPSSWLFKKEIYAKCGNWLHASDTTFPIDVEYLKRIVANGFKLFFVDALFIVKFPSPWWGLYSMKNNFPQSKYYDLIKSNPLIAENIILKECANAFAKKYNDSDLNFYQILRLLVRSIYYFLINFYGIKRFPMNRILLFRKKYNLKGNRIKRGLTHKNN